MITKQQSVKLRKLIVAYTNVVESAALVASDKEAVKLIRAGKNAAHNSLNEYIRTLTEGQ